MMKRLLREMILLICFVNIDCLLILFLIFNIVCYFMYTDHISLTKNENLNFRMVSFHSHKKNDGLNTDIFFVYLLFFHHYLVNEMQFFYKINV